VGTVTITARDYEGIGIGEGTLRPDRTKAIAVAPLGCCSPFIRHNSAWGIDGFRIARTTRFGTELVQKRTEWPLPRKSQKSSFLPRGFKKNQLFYIPLSNISRQLPKIKKGVKEMEIKMKYRFAFTLCVLLLLTGLSVGLAGAQEAEAAAVATVGMTEGAWIALATAATMVGSALAAGWAIVATGVAAAGATAEKPEISGRVLIFVALAEAIAIYGLLIAFMLWTKI
jgi:V/A-type H+-transporting ATPase subunit K